MRKYVNFDSWISTQFTTNFCLHFDYTWQNFRVYNICGHLACFLSLAMIWWSHPLIQSIHIFKVRKKLPKQVIEKKTHVISVFLFFFIITNEPSPKKDPIAISDCSEKKALDWKGKYPCPRKTKKKQSALPLPTYPQRTSHLPYVPKKQTWSLLQIAVYERVLK